LHGSLAEWIDASGGKRFASKQKPDHVKTIGPYNFYRQSKANYLRVFLGCNLFGIAVINARNAVFTASDEVKTSATSGSSTTIKASSSTLPANRFGRAWL
jgi:hypothetical protein